MKAGNGLLFSKTGQAILTRPLCVSRQILWAGHNQCCLTVLGPKTSRARMLLWGLSGLSTLLFMPEKVGPVLLIGFQELREIPLPAERGSALIVIMEAGT